MHQIVFLLFILTCAQVTAGSQSSALDRLMNVHSVFCKDLKPVCCPICPIGPKGERGHKGNRGKKGPRGKSGSSLEINNFIEATSFALQTLQAGDYIFFDPINYSLTGIQASGSNAMTLVESVPGSGNFDTITLPLETIPTFYVVTHAICADYYNTGDFQLVLNGTSLPYTDLAVNGSRGELLLSRTSVIQNPANTVGTLNVIALNFPGPFDMFPALSGGVTASITVIKLNNLGS